MANKHSIMTREMVESFCNSYYIPDEVHPTAPGRDRTITQFPEGKVGVYTIEVFPISVPLYMGGVLEKDPAPHLTARQEQAVQVLSSNKAPFRRHEVCLTRSQDCYPRKVQAEVQKGKNSGFGAGPEVSAPSAEENVVAEENVIPVGTYLDLMDPEGDLTVAEKGDAARKQPEKAKRKKLLKQSDTLPAKRLRVDHPSLASGTGGKTLASLRRTIPEGSLLLGPSSQADVHTQVTVRSSRVADAPVIRFA
ncbi:hypothetical protein Tco_0717732 [Tanacetum coccineum]